MKRTILVSFLLVVIVPGVAGLNLSEASVVDVERDGDRFSVTVIHDDAGEAAYANWWQVESMDGEQLGRRTLLHGHGTEEFTRSEAIDVSGYEEVVVRAHDQRHGYGGQAAIYTVATGETELVEQGNEMVSFSDVNDDGSRSYNRSVGETFTVDGSTGGPSDGHDGHDHDHDTGGEGVVAAFFSWLSGLW